jgi:hypothetical protein
VAVPALNHQPASLSKQTRLGEACTHHSQLDALRNSTRPVSSTSRLVAAVASFKAWESNQGFFDTKLRVVWLSHAPAPVAATNVCMRGSVPICVSALALVALAPVAVQMPAIAGRDSKFRSAARSLHTVGAPGSACSALCDTKARVGTHRFSPVHDQHVSPNRRRGKLVIFLRPGSPWSRHPACGYVRGLAKRFCELGHCPTRMESFEAPTCPQPQSR